MIVVNNVSKKYKKSDKFIIKDINCSIKDGEIVALLGHNGSGKSTLLKCMIGVLNPSCGEILIDGKNSFIHQKYFRNNIGVVFNQKPSFITDLDVIDNLLFFKAIYEIPDQQYHYMLNLIDSYLNIGDLYCKPYRKLSFGERVKCEITSVILHNPKYLFLDEPTIGLDYNAKAGLYSLLKYLSDTYNTTIIVVTHEVDYIEDVCTQAIILNKGIVRYSGNPEKITKAISHSHNIHVKYDAILSEDALNKLIDLSTDFNSHEQRISFTCNNIDELNKLQKEICTVFRIREFSSSAPTIKEVFEHVLQEIAENNENNG